MAKLAIAPGGKQRKRLYYVFRDNERERIELHSVEMNALQTEKSPRLEVPDTSD